MTWSYSGLPADIASDEVRFLAGQTSTGDPELVSDEEIAYALADQGTGHLAAAVVCEALAKRYTTKASGRTVGALSLTFQDRAKGLLEQAKDLRRQAGLRSAVPYAGGTSVSDKLSVAGDTDRPLTQFGVGMDDRPESGVRSST